MTYNMAFNEMAQIRDSTAPTTVPGSRQSSQTPVPGRISLDQSNTTPILRMDRMASLKQPCTPSENENCGNGLGVGQPSSFDQNQKYGHGRAVLSDYPFGPDTPRSPMIRGNQLERDVYSGFQNYSSPLGRLANGMNNIGPKDGNNPEHLHNGRDHLPPLSSASTFFPPEKTDKKPDIYPQFADGDVRITSPSGKIWKVHKVVLSKASPVLAILLASTPQLSSHKRHKDDKFVKWDIKLVADCRAEDMDPQGLQFMSFHKINVKEKQISTLPNYNGLGEQTGFDKLYDNLFRCMYSMEPIFTSAAYRLGSGTIYDANLLLQAATWLEAVPCVRLVIEANLLRLHQMLWKHNGEKPEGWIHVAATLQSPLIFREALIHLVGKFHLKNGIDERFLRKKAHGPMTEKIWALIVQKAQELKDKKLRVERVLLEFYPLRMVHNEDPETVPGRSIYTADIYLWQALTIFRQYISSSYLSNFHHKAKDGGLSFYRTLGAAHATYLRPDTLEKFHQSFDMSIKAKGLLVAALDLVKAEARNVVAELLHDRSQLVRGPNDQPRDHLTCIEILDQEMPWIVVREHAGERDIVMGGLNH
ncbi:uncharacterized protein RCO7_08869 [Rhynchosporium graminicola]|uniref:BTB domain-containing protein n=1 Tax=Rhynchosporium graminicola TaxID=2792576 RepID=A0A1E1KJE7_9HELO|nr:uncharacterized protein RCO7_08869 [Rhynchosporium commune]